jgi:hypothetical protein
VSVEALVTAVRSSLLAAGVTATVAFGKREVGKQINQGVGRANRIVFAPGDEAGALGSYVPAVPGRNIQATGVAQRRIPRALWDWNVALRVYVWAYDATLAEDELAQWGAMVELHDLTVEAIHTFCCGFYVIKSPRDPAKNIERRFGCETMFILEARIPVLASAGLRSGNSTNYTGATTLGDSDEEGC